LGDFRACQCQPHYVWQFIRLFSNVHNPVVQILPTNCPLGRGSQQRVYRTP
jgi:hypothetical protein